MHTAPMTTGRQAMDDEQGARLWVSRADLRQSRAVADPDAPAARPLADGEARVRIERFALTANNITFLGLTPLVLPSRPFSGIY